MTIYTRDEEITLLFEAFEKRTLLKEEWTHAAHLTVALVYCLNYPFGVARNLMRDGIYWLNDAHGTANTNTNGYHETLTCFWMTMVKDFLDQRDKNESLATLANDLAAAYGDTNLPLKFYSRERLFSVEARLGYVAPDLEPDWDFGQMFYDNFAPKVFV